MNLELTELLVLPLILTPTYPNHKCIFRIQVFVGRPALWGLAVGGQAGVQRMLQILRTELDYTFRISGNYTYLIITSSQYNKIYQIILVTPIY